MLPLEEREWAELNLELYLSVVFFFLLLSFPMGSALLSNTELFTAPQNRACPLASRMIPSLFFLGPISLIRSREVHLCKRTIRASVPLA